MMPHFAKAIVRRPSKSMIDGIASQELGLPNYDLALKQHDAYIAALEFCGIAVTVLPALEEFPDSCFVEDVALVSHDFAILTNPGAASRNQETSHMRSTLEKFYSSIDVIEYPGTLDAGDVLMVDEHFYIGLSERTNHQGAEQLSNLLKQYRRTSSSVTMSEMLHLKTGVNYLDKRHILVCGEFINKPEFAKFNRLIVDATEAYAANSLWINDKVIVPEGFPVTLAMIQQAGFETLSVNVSEFEKLDGGLSCLSLRF